MSTVRSDTGTPGGIALTSLGSPVHGGLVFLYKKLAYFCTLNKLIILFNYGSIISTAIHHLSKINFGGFFMTLKKVNEINYDWISAEKLFIITRDFCSDSKPLVMNKRAALSLFGNHRVLWFSGLYVCLEEVMAGER